VGEKSHSCVGLALARDTESYLRGHKNTMISWLDFERSDGAFWRSCVLTVLCGHASLVSVACTGGASTSVIDAAVASNSPRDASNAAGCLVGECSGARSAPQPDSGARDRGLVEDAGKPIAPSDGVAIPAQCASLRGAAVTRQLGFPGSGVQIELRVSARSGDRTAVGDVTQCMRLRDATSMTDIPAPIVGHEADAAFTLLLVAAGSTPDASARARAAAEALIGARPASERIAVFRWAEDVVQLDTFATSRDRVRAQLATRLGTRSGSPIAIEAALEAVHDDVAKLEDDAVAALRSVVVIAPDLDLEHFTGSKNGTDPVLIMWLTRSMSQEAIAANEGGTVFTTDTAATDAARVAELNARLDAARKAGFYRLGYCGDGVERPVVLEILGDAPDLQFTVQDNLDEERGGACDPMNIASREHAYSDRMSLVFTTAERATYERNVSMLQQDDFTGALQLAPWLAPTPIALHLHGETSLSCARKSFTFDLDRKRGRHLMPASSTDEYMLLLTCQAEFYIGQLAATELLQQLGLFPLRWRAVELTIDGQSNGSYMLLEKYKEELVQDFSRVTSVIRRRNDAAGVAPEVKFAAADEPTAIADYEQILPRALQQFSGPALERALRERMDLDLYLTWVATMTVLGTGDYIDELVFYGTQTRDSVTGAPRTFFTPVAWDPDDTFSPCHDLSFNAIVDPNGLLYCAESGFDRLIFRDPHLYGLYADALERTIAFITEERFGKALQNGKDQLYPLLERDAVRQANVEFRDWTSGAMTRDEYLAAIDAEGSRELAALRDNRARLTKSIANYRMHQ
jgi:hypothetical protein